jgi:hypothetical protein
MKYVLSYIIIFYLFHLATSPKCFLCPVWTVLQGTQDETDESPKWTKTFEP